ncbi:hypothetical protein SAMN05660297_02731 [Natronincola peptidivorans]|uniref:Haemolysin XhlA n=1 Tax=Natronincola peptidivorans TaxID=426128 RepID=A0A1I0FAU6_9FIRM|nr:hypothetical protein [Natronincola peptidivorans]SET55055.1 hypothetical protein SAMN05660297_02731 [Natronincola peptidivorans]
MVCERHVEVTDSLKNHETRIAALERCTDVEKERTDMIFKILNEIKDSIGKIATKIEEIESRPNKLLWGAMGAVLGAIIMSGIKYL